MSLRLNKLPSQISMNRDYNTKLTVQFEVEMDLFVKGQISCCGR